MSKIVVFRGCPEVVVLGHEVVEPPEPGGDVVGHHHVYGVVAAAQQEESHPQHTEQQAERVESSAVAI